MRRFALILALVLPALAVLLLAGDVIDLSAWFESGSSDDETLESADWLDEDGGEASTGPSLAGRADLAALAAEERARLDAAVGPDGGGSLAGAGSKGPGVPFKGQVLDPDGRPAAGVTVVATADGREQRFLTDDDGRFHEALAPGRYRLVLTAPGVGSRLINRYLVDGSAEDDLELTLLAPATLKVVVLRGPEGVPGVQVTITARGFDESAETTFGQQTDLDGVAMFEEVPRATYDVVAEVPDGPTILQKQGAWADVRELKLQIPDAVTLRGKVTSGVDGPGVSGALITLQVTPDKGQGLFETVCESGPDGTYEVAVPRGRARRFDVLATGYAPWPNPTDGRQRKTLYRSLGALRKAKLVTQDVPLTSGASVVGQATDEAGKPIPGIRLLLKPRRASSVLAWTDDQGRYTAAELNPDRYEVLVETPSWFPENRLIFDIPAQQTQPVMFDFVLQGARTFEGVVLSKTSKPVYGARVWIIGGGRPVGSARQAGRDLEVFTDSAGRFVMTDVPSELSVALRATYGDMEASPVWVPSDKPVPASIRLELEETGAIEGTCFDLVTRENVGGAKIHVQPVEEPFGRNRRSIDVGKNGQFKLTRLIPGKWALTPEKSGYLRGDPIVIDVPPSDRPVSKDLPLDPGLVIAGIVSDITGRPLAKARVDIGGRVDGQKVRGRSAQTDGQGRFRLTGFLRGVYQMTVRRGGFVRKDIPNLGGGEDRMLIALDRASR